MKAQAWRFVRYAGGALLTALIATGFRVSWADLLALVVGAAEVAYRQMYPTVPIAGAAAPPTAPPGA
jgi:hypothetical protein